MSIEESKGKEAVEGLKDSMKEYSNEKVTFVNTTDLLEALAYIAELEAKVGEPEKLDADTELAVGDTVRTMISYETVTGDGFPGNSVGTVKEITTDEYPIKVQFEKYPYTVGYERHELGKVSP